jgi:hypothetical protein
MRGCRKWSRAHARPEVASPEVVNRKWKGDNFPLYSFTPCANINFIVFGLIRSLIETTIYAHDASTLNYFTGMMDLSVLCDRFYPTEQGYITDERVVQIEQGSDDGPFCSMWPILSYWTGLHYRWKSGTTWTWLGWWTYSLINHLSEQNNGLSPRAVPYRYVSLCCSHNKS